MTQKKLVENLLKLSENSEGLVEAGRVKAVCAFVEQKFSEINAVKILKLYKKGLDLRIAQQSSKVFYSGSLDDASKQVLAAFAKSKGAISGLEFLEEDKLIAGIKISVGDRVWENSLRLRLEMLAQSLGV